MYIIMGERVFDNSAGLLGSESLISIFYRYGRHGGFGFQSSWGCAAKVLEILDNALLHTGAT